MIRPSIYISHAWGGESEEITQKIMKRFQDEGIKITLDKNDLGYRESINDFMLNLGAADAIIIVVSNKYLHSEYCMFELLQIYKNKNILDRIFPVVLDEVNIAKSTDRLDLVKYWETQSNELENKIRDLDSISNIEGITDDLNLYKSIRNNIAHLTAILKDINTLNITLHKESDFEALFNAVSKKVQQNQDEAMADAIETVTGTVYEPSNPSQPRKQKESDYRSTTIKDPQFTKTNNKRKNRLPFLLGLLGVLIVGYFALSNLDIFPNESENKDKLAAQIENPENLESQSDNALNSSEESTTDPIPNKNEPVKKVEVNNEIGGEKASQDLNEDISNSEPKINAAPERRLENTIPVRIFLDRSISKANFLINGKPIEDYKGTKTLNILEAELPVGNQEFTVMKRNDTCRVFKQIRIGENEISLTCN